jgi:hypothetical protein
MRTKHLFALVALFASGASFAADTIAVDLSQGAAARSRADVAAETRRALAAGEIKNGPLAGMYDVVTPGAATQALAQQGGPARKDVDTQVAAVQSTAKK